MQKVDPRKSKAEKICYPPLISDPMPMYELNYLDYVHVESLLTKMISLS